MGKRCLTEQNIHQYKTTIKFHVATSKLALWPTRSDEIIRTNIKNYPRLRKPVRKREVFKAINDQGWSTFFEPLQVFTTILDLTRGILSIQILS